MISKSFTLQLDGDISLERFTAALGAWQSAVTAIGKNLGSKHILKIEVDELQSGSAIVNIQVTFDGELPAKAFNRDYDRLGAKARGDNVVDFPSYLNNSVKRIQDVASLDADKGITLASETADVLILPVRDSDSSSSSLTSSEILAAHSETYGVVTGRLQSLSSRSGLRIVIYDDLFDKAVRCTLTEEQHETIRDLWDQEVVVEGFVRRDSRTGRPLSIREVRNISQRKVPGDRYAWLKARGAMKNVRPDLSSEELMRLVRNG